MKTRDIALKDKNQALKDESETFRTSTRWKITKMLRKIRGKR